MQFSADKVHVVSGSDDGTVRAWDVAVGEEVNRLVGHTDYVRAVAASRKLQAANTSQLENIISQLLCLLQSLPCSSNLSTS